MLTAKEVVIAYAVGFGTAALCMLGIRFGMWWGDRFG